MLQLFCGGPPNGKIGFFQLFVGVFELFCSFLDQAFQQRNVDGGLDSFRQYNLLAAVDKPIVGKEHSHGKEKGCVFIAEQKYSCPQCEPTAKGNDEWYSPRPTTTR